MRIRATQRKSFLSLLAAGSLLLGGGAQAAPGGLDTTFNSTGYVATTVSAYQGEWRSVRPLSDGRVLAVGTGYWNLDVRFAPITGIAAVYNANGSLDTSFGNGGVYVHNTVMGTPTTLLNDGIRLTDGKFLLVGRADVSSGTNDILLVRLNANGSLDTTFGSATPGSLRINLGVNSRGGLRVASHPDGGVVVVAAGSNNGNVHVLRLTNDGAPINSFNGSGRRDQAFDVVYTEQTPVGLAVQPDGKILIGSSENGGGGDFAVLRLNADGSNDNTFDEKVPGAPNRDGKAIYSYGNSQEVFFDLLLQPDGKVVVAGATRATTADTFRGTLLRANSNGTWDTTFNGGSVVTDVAGYHGERFQRVLRQSDGSFVVIGNATLNTAFPQYHRLLVGHYSADGVLDTTLGDGGFQTHAVGTCLSTYAAGMDSNGRLYGAGESTTAHVAGDECSGTGNFALTRLQAVPVPDTFPPAILSTSPASGDTGVKRSANIEVTFDEPLNPDSVVDGAIEVVCENYGPIAGTVFWRAEPPALVFDPVDLLPTYRSCTVTLQHDGARDLAGNGIFGSTQWSFRTVKKTKLITAAKRGLGAGTVTGHGVGANSHILSINCGDKCSASVLVGNTYVLEATAAPGSKFMKWLNCPQAEGATCVVPAVDRDRTITASFQPE